MEFFPRKSNGCRGIVRNHSGFILLSIAFLLLPKLATSITACEYHQCRPDCICDVRFDDICASDYGNYGWIVPENHGEYLYNYMRPDSKIGDFDIKPAGMRGRNERIRGSGEGIGEITSVDMVEMSGKVFFEVHPDRLQNNQVSVELYGKTQFGLDGCDKSGPPLTSSGWFSSTVSEFPTYNDKYRNNFFECHPRATNAVMGAVDFTIINPFGEIVQNNLWIPANENQKKEGYDGDFLYCIRVNVIKNGKVANFIDTKIKISGSQEANNFRDKKSLRMFSAQPIESKHAHVLKQNIEVGAFPCKIPDGTETKPTYPIYSLGQDISICVGPTENFVETFEVTGFKNVTCANSGQSRQLIVDDENDILTKVETSATGFTNLGTGITLLDAGIMAVSSKITMGLVQRGDNSMTCSGEAYVASKGSRRSLSNVLEREERPTTSTFEVTIGLEKFDPTAISGSESLYSRHRLWRFGLFLLPPAMAVASVVV